MRRGRGAAVGWIIASVALVAMTAGGAVPTRTAQAQRGARIGPLAPEISGGPSLNSAPLSLTVHGQGYRFSG